MTVTDGLFHVLLGSVTALPESLFDAPDRWVGLSVNGDGEMTPRTRLVSVPFALVAANPGPQGPQGDIGPQGLQGPAGPVAGSDGQIIFNNNGNAAGAEIYYNSITHNVGIGVSNPQTSLQITGNNGVDFAGTHSLGDPIEPAPGVHMLWIPEKGAFRAGLIEGSAWDSNEAADYSTGFGHDTNPYGLASFAAGWNCDAANNAVAMGYANNAEGVSSAAFNYNTTAAGDYSFSAGYHSTADGIYSTAFGYHTTAVAFSSVAVGMLNIGLGNSSAWVSTDPIFEVGNGGGTTPSNAMTILKNGNVGIGTTSPEHLLEVTGYASDDVGVGHFQNTSYTDGYGVYGSCINSDSHGYGGWFDGGYMGALGKSVTNTGNYHYGLEGAVISSSGTNYTLYGFAYGGNTN